MGLNLIGFVDFAIIGATLSEIGNVKIIISGHTDRQPFAGKSQTESDRLNMQLSKDRADAVALELAKMGVSTVRIQTKGYGSTQPETHGDTPEAYARNRRVTIEIAE